MTTEKLDSFEKIQLTGIQSIDVRDFEINGERYFCISSLRQTATGEREVDPCKTINLTVEEFDQL